MAIPMRLNTHGRTAVATATRLPTPHRVRGRNDKLQRPLPHASRACYPNIPCRIQGWAGDCRRLIQHAIIGQGPVFGCSQTYYLHQAVLRVLAQQRRRPIEATRRSR